MVVFKIIAFGLLAIRHCRVHCMIKHKCCMLSPIITKTGFQKKNMKISLEKKSHRIFLKNISVTQTIECSHTLEPPRQGSSIEYP